MPSILVKRHSRRTRRGQVARRAVQEHAVDDVHDPICEQDIRLDNAHGGAAGAKVVAHRVEREAECLARRMRPVRVWPSEERRVHRRAVDQL